MNQIRLSKLLFVGLLFVLVACQAQATPAAPTAVLSTAAPTAVPPTTAPTVAPTLASTTFSPKSFRLPLSVSFGLDWQVAYDVPGKFAIDNQHDFGLAIYVVTRGQLADPIDGHLIPFPND